MSAFVRLWLLNDAMGEISEAHASVLRASDSHLCYAAPSSRDFAASLRSALGKSLEIVEWVERCDDLALRRLADRHGGLSLLVVVPLAGFRDICSAALATSRNADTAIEFDASRMCTIDWPPSADPEGRPAFIGLDLDWNPPPPPIRRAKFPGGPGSAPAARG